MKYARRAAPIARYASELVGTFFLVVTIGCNLHAGSIGAALSVGSVLAGMVTALCSISGAHFNPAITLAVWLCGRGAMTVVEALCYVASQVLGGILGTFTYWGVIGKELRQRPMFPYALAEAFSLEVVYTWALVYVFLNVMLTDSRTKELGFTRPANGLAVGLAFTAAAVAIGPLSGCSLNPAVTIGAYSAARALTGGGRPLLSIYTIAPFAGSLLGAFSFYLVRGGCRGEYQLDEDAWSAQEARRYAGGLSPKGAAAEGRVVKMRPDDHGPPPWSFRLSGKEPVTLPAGIIEHRLYCGLRWKMRSGLRGTDETCDIDLSCVKFGQAGDCLGGVYFNEKEDLENGIHHSGDEVVGRQAIVDSEAIMLRLSDIKPEVHALVFVMTIYSSEQSFDDVQQCHLRIVDVTNDNKEFCRYERNTMSEGANGLIGAMLYRAGGGKWCFKAVDEIYALPPNSSYRKLVPQMSTAVVQAGGVGFIPQP